MSHALEDCGSIHGARGGAGMGHKIEDRSSIEGLRGGSRMSHKLKVGQTVVQAFRGGDPSVTFQIVRLEPACPGGEPQYLIRCPLKGHRRVVRETEIAPAFL